MWNVREKIFVSGFILLVVIVWIWNPQSMLITRNWLDVSEDTEFRSIIGLELVLVEPLVLCGITLDTNYEKVIDYYEVVPKPGWGSLEVLSKITFPVGSKLKIERVVKSGGFLPGLYKIELVIVDGPKLKEVPIRMKYKWYRENGKNFFKILNT
jgi:hypothetical protein